MYLFEAAALLLLRPPPPAPRSSSSSSKQQQQWRQQRQPHLSPLADPSPRHGAWRAHGISAQTLPPVCA